MKLTSRRGLVLYALVLAFFAGIVMLVVSVCGNANDWVMQRYNGHLYHNGQLIGAGVIADRNGTNLVSTQDGKRVYNSSETIRRATLHTLGDAQGVISSGVQSVYSAELTGYNLVNGVYSIKKYGRGNDINLTLDADLCATAYNKLNGRKGAVVVTNYKTGEILCMVSTPTFDPENVPKNIEGNDDYEGVYLNRVLSGQYAPGSSFKIVTSACAIENDKAIDSKTWKCTGEYKTTGGIVYCNGVHGTVNFKQALAKSCNSAFAQIAEELGNDKLTATANKLGYNQQLMMDETKVVKSFFHVDKATPADLGWASIGQYTVLTSPFQQVRLLGAIANNGTAVEPYLLDSIKTAGGLTTKKGGSSGTKSLMSVETAQQLKTMLRYNVTSQYGKSTFPGLNVCGKSGTAEVVGKKPNAWFVGFLDDDQHPYAVAVVVENAGGGMANAAPIVNAVLQKAVK